MRTVLLESFLVALGGIVLAFASNSLSPRGLNLTRNYFPGGALSRGTLGSNGHSTEISTTELVENRLRAEGLQVADSNLVAKLFTDSGKQQGQILFIDARDDEHYQAGHIPGAFQLDHYHPERYLATVLPACQAAQQLLVYCKGGSCEDSEQTAIFLSDAGVPKEKLFVYPGGFDEWTANHQPIEVGERNGLTSPPLPRVSGGTGQGSK